MMLLPCSWHQGRHNEMQKAMPSCVNSTSPWIGVATVARPTMLATTISATSAAAKPPATANHQASRASSLYKGDYFLYLPSNSRASASMALPGRLRLSMSAIQSSYSGADALTQLSSSALGIM
jgi:hypothetical protein